MGNITVGYFDLQTRKFISDSAINTNFTELLARYVKLVSIPVKKRADIQMAFRKAGKYKLDYIYVDAYNFLLESFLLREKLALDIPFILTLHTIYVWFMKYIYLVPLIRQYDIIYAVSDYARKSFLRICDRFDIRAIPHCLDIGFIHDNIDGGHKEDRKVITFMGRLVESKGIEELIRCMPEIIAKAGDAHLNIIGPLSGEKTDDKPKSRYVRKLQKIVNEFKLMDRVHFKGVQTGLDKYRLLSESDVFVSPTIALEETFLMSNLEALACGVPVVTTNWAANNELIKHGRNGFLIDTQYSRDQRPRVNTRQLIYAIVKILSRKRLQHKMKADALAIARGYDYRRVIPRIVSLLKKRKPARQKWHWNAVKDKTVIDFYKIFNRDFFFFVNLGNFFRKNTYAALYSELTSVYSFNKKRAPRYKKIGMRKRAKDFKMMKMLSQNFRDFLLLNDLFYQKREC